MVKKETKSLGRDPFEDMEDLDWGEAKSTADESVVDKAAAGETTTETEAVEAEPIPGQAEAQPEMALDEIDADAEAEAVEPVVEAEAVEAEPVPSATDVPSASEQAPSTTDVPPASEQAPSTSSGYGPSLLALFGISPAEEAASSTSPRSFGPGTKASGHDLSPDEGPVLAQVEAQPETEPGETAAGAETKTTEPLAKTEAVETEPVLGHALHLACRTSAEAQPETEPVEVAADAEVEPGGELFPLDVDREDEKESELIAPDEETNRFLDELIATIDYQVEQTFGPQAMADSSATAPVDGDAEQHVIFALAGTEYAVPIANVTEIGPPLNVTPLPNVPDWILGVANLRGDVVSMVDLRAFLGMARTNYDQASRMLVAQARQEDMTAGLIVDRVSGIRFLPMDQIVAPTAAIEDQVAPYLRGVYEHDGRLLVVLDFDRLLLSPEMQQFQPM